jgi:DNA-binding transcriptional LysR family regulator
MVDLVDLKNFLILCETRNFGRAAERCSVSTSGLSRRISGLEQWIGAPLFDRTTPVLELTDAGNKLLGVASQSVYALEGVRKFISESQSDRRMQIRFSAPHIISTTFFPDWIPRLYSEFQQAKLRVNSDHLQECFQMLDQQESDFVVSLLDAAGGVREQLNIADFSAQYEQLTLAHEIMIPVSAPDRSGQPRYSIGSTSDKLSFLNYDGRCSLGWALQRALKQWQIPSRLIEYHQHNLSNGVRDLALSGLGVAWLPQTLVRNDLLTRQLVKAGEGFDVAMHVVIFRRKDALTGLAETLWGALRQRHGQ